MADDFYIPPPAEPSEYEQFVNAQLSKVSKAMDLPSSLWINALAQAYIARSSRIFELIRDEGWALSLAAVSLDQLKIVAMRTSSAVLPQLQERQTAICTFGARPYHQYLTALLLAKACGLTSPEVAAPLYVNAAS